MIEKFITSKISGYMAVFQILAILGVLVGAYLYIDRQGFKRAVAAYQTKEIEVAEKRNEIANNKPDTKRLLDGLHRHDSSWQ